MATEGGTLDLAVVDQGVVSRLTREPFSFEFFQAVRLLGRILSGRSPVGHFQHPGTEVVRFSAHPSMSFPASEIQSLTGRENVPPLMAVNFMGLTGPSGVLPLYYTELVMERLQARDTAIRDFLDIFNHRSVSLFYRAWEKHRLPVACELGESSAFLQLLISLVGLGTPGLRNRQAVDDWSLVFFGGLLGQQPRSAIALERVLADYFDVPVEVEQFVGVWCELDKETQTWFDELNGSSAELGRGAVIGDEVWDLQSRVRIKLGPLSLGRYLDFLPSGSAYAPLRAMARFFSGGALDFEVQLILQRDEVPSCVLGTEGETAPRLGWLTWGRSRPMDRDPADTVLQF